VSEWEEHGVGNKNKGPSFFPQDDMSRHDRNSAILNIIEYFLDFLFFIYIYIYIYK
jgi:hypothetical protein